MFKGLTIFLLATTGLEKNLQRRIIEFIIQQGFYLLTTQICDLSAINKLKDKLGWTELLERESLELSGILIVAFDVFPLAPISSKLDNARILKVKELNKYLNHPQVTSNSAQILHSTANSEEAWTILQILFSNRVDSICQKITQLKTSFATHYPVLKNLSSGLARRAKVELIEYEKKLAVKKTFRLGCERFLQRELFVMKELSKLRPEIPPLLDCARSFVIYPYYQDTLNFTSSENKQIPLEIAQQSMEILYFFYKLGYALIDFHPKNLLLDRKKGLKIIDFEFLYRYKVKPKSFEKSYDLTGIPQDFDGDIPIRSLSKKRLIRKRNYQTVWQPYIGLELHELLDKLSL
ncbi:MAG: hypothetical protein SAL07_20275 [Oscillatoria sp. PMC 1051.18]|nr:hypothetical protein [Oscillatoria sp. PMC 1050.18]MEC5032243.1 hypothetical protein [Oscillatoria sp. PMC 1051.18]